MADAQELPFDDDTFDAVITESVTAFPADKQEAVREYLRVTKPGGYEGLNESTWLKTPPPPEPVAWASQEVGAQVQPQSREAWVGLLEGAGLGEIVVHVQEIDTRNEAKGIVGRNGWRGMLGVFRRMLSLYVRNSHYREFVRGVRQDTIAPDHLQEYIGYGLYVRRKADVAAGGP